MQLKTLGGLALEGSALTRPKPLLVLTYLTLEGAAPRRTLAELFFGDAADPRDSLSTTLRHLRRAGAATELSDDRLSSAVPSDASRLIADFDEFRYQAVVDAYTGPFLDGFEVELGVEVEEWVFSMREAIAGRVRTAALHRARQALTADRLDEARQLTALAVHAPGAGELESDELVAALSLATQLESPDVPRLRALAVALGVDGLVSSAPGAHRPGRGSAGASLHRTTRFVGRETELDRLIRRLQDPDTRLVTVVGLGGIGKTRLALRAVDWLVGNEPERYSDGVHVVGLEGAGAGDAVGLIATGLGLPPTAGLSPGRLVESLRTWRALLMLDNLEHVSEAIDVVTTLLEDCPGLRVLGTSRRRLGLAAEHTLELRGLETNGQPYGRSDAAQLFLDRARRVGAPREELEAHAEAIEALCRDLEGYPLGIELAASWAKAFDPEVIHDMLRDGLDVLDQGPADAPARHRAARAALEPTWDMLGAEDRGVMEGLASFEGSFAFDAATAVAGVTLPTLSRLVDHALLRSVGGGRGRFSLHPVLRAFVRERMAPEVRVQTDARHEAFFYDLLERSLQRIERESSEVTDRLEADLSDLLKAIRGGLTGADPGRGVRMARWLVVEADFLFARPAGRSLLDLTQAAVDGARALGAVTDVERLLTKLASARRTLEDDLMGAIDTYRRALATVVASGDVGRQAALHAVIGAVYHDAGDEAACDEHLATAQGLAERHDDPLVRCEVLQRVGYVAARRGQWELTRRVNAEAVDVLDELGIESASDSVRAASLQFFCLLNLGGALDELGDMHASILIRQRALALGVDRGHGLWITYAHENLASAYADIGRFHDALDHGVAALEGYARLGLSQRPPALVLDVDRWRRVAEGGEAES